jgi:hypothetical protein
MRLLWAVKRGWGDAQMRCECSVVAFQAGARTLKRAAATVLVAICVPAFAVASASAVPGHRYVGQFGGPGSTFGAFSGPAGLAVKQSTGDVYVADQSNARVQEFDAAGEFVVAFDGSATPTGAFSFPTGVAVDPASGDVYVTDQGNNAVDRFTSSGAYMSQLDAATTPAGTFSSPSGIAVDPSDGDVYVADSGNVVVDVFNSTGEYQTQFGAGFLTFPTALAVDGASNVYVEDAGIATVYKYAALGAGEPTVIDPGIAQTVGVNPVSDEVYVGENGPAGYQIGDFSAAGSRVYTFGVGRIGASAGIAVKASNDEVYVADQANSDVARFTSFVAPAVTTGGASEVTSGGASISGTVNPEGFATSSHFEFGIEPAYGGLSPDVEAGAGSADVPAGYVLEGLQPNTTYHYRLTASNTLGSNVGEDATFTTSPAPPLVDDQAPFASGVTATTATLHATIDPRNSSTAYHFNYGTSTAYGSSAPTPDAQGGSAGEEAVSTQLAGLVPSTTYHFQVVADNGTGGPVTGEDQTFTTLPPQPVASTGAAAAITTSSAMLSGSANTVGLAGSYQFLITGVDTPGGGATIPQALPATNGATAVSDTITGLSPAAHYTYRLAVTTAGGTVYGTEQPLITAPVPPNEHPTGANGTGPFSTGLPTPTTQLVAFAAPPAETVAKPIIHHKPKPKKHKNRHKRKATTKRSKQKAKKTNTNHKGQR